MRLRLLSIVGLLLVLAFVFVLPALAQAVTVPDKAKTLDDLNSWLLTITQGVGGGAFATLLTQAIKRVLPDVPAAYIQLTVALVITIAVWIGRDLGIKADDILGLVEGIAKLVAAFITAVTTSTVAYTVSRDANIPLLGYSRSKP